MLTRLRNKMLLLNMISTLFLMIISFSVIFAITYVNVEKEINQSLFRTFSFHRSLPPPPHSMPGKNTAAPAERKIHDTRNFLVFVTSDGEVKTNSMFGENNELYENVTKKVLAQNSEEGGFTSDSAYWRFLTRKNPDGSLTIALADITAERAIITRLVISFIICSVILLFIVFFISLIFANRSILPVRKAWEKQKQFVADASHELKTPLAAINTNIDVLLSHPEKNIGEEEKWLKNIKQESERLSSLTSNLLFMARLDSTAQIPLTRTLLSEVFESSILTMEAVAFETGKNFSYSIEKDIYADVNSEQMLRLAMILMDNAIKYASSGSTIEINFARTQKDTAVFSVKNYGDIIPADALDKIFDRFYRVDTSRTGSSYGLGLSIAKEICQLHKAVISVTSSKEDGTCFFVSIPL